MLNDAREATGRFTPAGDPIKEKCVVVSERGRRHLAEAEPNLDILLSSALADDSSFQD